eukprot:101406-Chlamydomonas_euryale.AAC.12
MCASSYTVAWVPPTVAKRSPSLGSEWNVTTRTGEPWLSLMTVRSASRRARRAPQPRTRCGGAAPPLRNSCLRSSGGVQRGRPEAAAHTPTPVVHGSEQLEHAHSLSVAPPEHASRMRMHCCLAPRHRPVCSCVGTDTQPSESRSKARAARLAAGPTRCRRERRRRGLAVAMPPAATSCRRGRRKFSHCSQRVKDETKLQGERPPRKTFPAPAPR